MQTLQNVGAITASLGTLACGYGYGGATAAPYGSAYAPAGGVMGAPNVGIPGAYNMGNFNFNSLTGGSLF